MSGYPIEKQVCTLDQAKKLAELLGDDAPESLYVRGRYHVSPGERPHDFAIHYIDALGLSLDKCFDKFYPAYTGDELGVLLPKEISNDPESPAIFKMLRNGGDFWPYVAGYSRNAGMGFLVHKNRETEAEAKAALAIELLEKKIIPAAEFKY
jgi:hypothetical protein